MTQTPLELQQPDVAPLVEDEMTARRAEEICAHLLIHRWLPKRSTRDLLIDDRLRASVERRLDGVGLQLIDSYTSSYFAVRLKPSIESDVRFDWATNARLPRGAVALLVILWTRLVLPRRVASDEARRRRLEDPDGEPQAKERLPTPMVARSALYAEFGHRFGKIAFARYVSQLKSNGFLLENRQGQLREGPLLDVLVDGVTMARKLRDSVLWDLMERDGDAAPEAALPGMDEPKAKARKPGPRRQTKAPAAAEDADDAVVDQDEGQSRDDPGTAALVAVASAALAGGDDDSVVDDAELEGADDADLVGDDDSDHDSDDADEHDEDLADEDAPARGALDDDDDFGDWGDP